MVFSNTAFAATNNTAHISSNVASSKTAISEINETENKIKNLEKVTGTNDIIKSVNVSNKNNELVSNRDLTIKIPKNLSESIKITDNENYKNILEINLPNENNNAKAIKSERGTIIYNATKNVDFAVQPTIDGFRSLININNVNASKEYRFKIKLPNGSKLVSAEKYLGKEFDTKEVFIVDSNNISSSIFSPAWAKDANGESLPTYYRIEGDTLIQVVEFNENSTFPIVADPDWWKISKCAAAITLVIGSAAIPTAKLTKIKKYVKALGGVKEAAMLLMGATSAAEKGAAVKEALTALAAEIIGIAEIEDQCY